MSDPNMHRDQMLKGLRKHQQLVEAGTPLDSAAATDKAVRQPLARRWLPLATAQPAATDPASAPPSPPFALTVLSYNVLAQKLVRRDQFPYCSHAALKVSFRKESLLLEILNIGADILALQEVDTDLYSSWWAPRLGAMGYKSEWASRERGKHGCAVFYRKAKFVKFAATTVQYAELGAPHALSAEALDPDRRHTSVFEELSRPNVGQIVGLRVIQAAALPGQQPPPDLGLVVTNTHLFWDPRYRFVRLKQVSLLLERLVQFQQEHSGSASASAYPAILMGDWNSTPDNIIYRFLTQRHTLLHDTQLWHKFLTPAEHGS
jgi:CCR4-NOT transcription complex subunit 6